METGKVAIVPLWQNGRCLSVSRKDICLICMRQVPPHEPLSLYFEVARFRLQDCGESESKVDARKPLRVWGETE